MSDLGILGLYWCGCLPYGWAMLLGGAVGLVVGSDASVGLLTLVDPADGSVLVEPATIVIGAVSGLEVDRGTASGLNVDEGAVEAVGADLDDTDGCAEDATVWVGCEDKVASEGPIRTGWDEVGATWVGKDEAEVGWVDGEAAECVAEGVAVGDIVAGFAGVA